MKDEHLNEIRGATAMDEDLRTLGEVILKGWPDDRKQVPQQLRPYFHFKDEVTIQDGLIMKRERIVIPTSFNKDLFFDDYTHIIQGVFIIHMAD